MAHELFAKTTDEHDSADIQRYAQAQASGPTRQAVGHAYLVSGRGLGTQCILD